MDQIKILNAHFKKHSFMTNVFQSILDSELNAVTVYEGGGDDLYGPTPEFNTTYYIPPVNLTITVVYKNINKAF